MQKQTGFSKWAKLYETNDLLIKLFDQKLLKKLWISKQIHHHYWNIIVLINCSAASDDKT